MTLAQKIASKTNAKRGQVAQDTVCHHLIAMGFKCVAEIATPKKVFVGKTIYTSKVAGDFYALGKDGRGVLVEVKCRTVDNLHHSDFQPHQITRLDEYQENKGLSLVAWVNFEKVDRVAILNWKTIGFQLREKGGSISWDRAQLDKIN